MNIVKPIYIAHRINTIEELEKVPHTYGIEIDIRDGLIVVHDPFCSGVTLDEFLQHYHHRFIILNIKCERLEYPILDMLKKYHITEYFFLDSSFPMIYKLTEEGNRNVAIRYSEYEHSILEMTGRCNWIWIDSFNDTLSLTKKDFISFKNSGFKICIVSPELHGYDKIDNFIQEIQQRGIYPDMICTKVYNIDRWKKL